MSKGVQTAEVTRSYARKPADSPGRAALADMTGFSPEGMGRALAGLNNLPRKLTPVDWTPENLFGKGSGTANLFGVMLRIPQLKSSLEEIGGEGFEKKRIGELTQTWMQGHSIHEIAEFFFESGQTKTITAACKAIYKNLANTGTWGLAALSKLPNSGIDFEKLSESERRRINTLPAMIYHGVKTEEAVLMRMNSAPRSVGERLGVEFKKSIRKSGGETSVNEARDFLKRMKVSGWNRVSPKTATLSGSDYKNVWELLSGERDVFMS